MITQRHVTYAASVQLIHLAVASAVTASIAGVSYAAFKPKDVEHRARVVAAQADCRAVNEAIVAYVSINDRDPKSIADLRGLVQGDISAYRIVEGLAAGPGC
ncbi:MAG TPA: hypothetical protein VGD29_30805 [Actinoplanes sp.]